MIYACWKCGERWIPIRVGTWAPQGTGTDPDCHHGPLHAVPGGRR